MKLAAGCAVSWFMGGKYHSNRLSKQLKTKFQKEQKQLYTQYYNDVYKLSEQNAELSSYTESLKDALKQTEAKHEMEAIQRDYDEFKQPDIDGDDRISRAEFNMYVKNYLCGFSCVLLCRRTGVTVAFRIRQVQMMKTNNHQHMNWNGLKFK